MMLKEISLNSLLRPGVRFTSKFIPGCIKILLFCILLCTGSGGILFAQNVETDISVEGPLRGYNTFIPYSLFLHSPAMPSAPMEKGAWEFGLNFYLTNDFHSYKLVMAGGATEYHRINDYESIIAECMLQHQFTESVSAIGIVRYAAYWTGFMDEIIEGFHSVFGFQNAGREYFPNYEVLINLTNNNGLEIYADSSVAALGDTDLWLKYAFAVPWADAAVWAGMKLPTGAISGESIISTGYPDFALQASADVPYKRYFMGYFQGGVTVPGDLLFSGGTQTPTPFFHGLAALGFNPGGNISYLGQLNVKTTVLSGPINHWLFNVDRLLLPQTNLLFGIVSKIRGYRWQFYFEEDFLTNEGADLTVGVQVSRQFR